MRVGGSRKERGSGRERESRRERERVGERGARERAEIAREISREGEI